MITKPARPESSRSLAFIFVRPDGAATRACEQDTYPWSLEVPGYRATPGESPHAKAPGGAPWGTPAEDRPRGFSCTLRLRRRFLQQRGDAFRSLSAIRKPMVDALPIDAQSMFTAPGHGIEEAYPLDGAAAPAFPPVGHNDMIERLFLRARSRKTNLYHEPNLESP